LKKPDNSLEDSLKTGKKRKSLEKPRIFPKKYPSQNSSTTINSLKDRAKLRKIKRTGEIPGKSGEISSKPEQNSPFLKENAENLAKPRKVLQILSGFLDFSWNFLEKR
jgi:hypothetical protein